MASILKETILLEIMGDNHRFVKPNEYKFMAGDTSVRLFFKKPKGDELDLSKAFANCNFNNIQVDISNIINFIRINEIGTNCSKMCENADFKTNRKPIIVNNDNIQQNVANYKFGNITIVDINHNNYFDTKFYERDKLTNFNNIFYGAKFDATTWINYDYDSKFYKDTTGGKIIPIDNDLLFLQLLTGYIQFIKSNICDDVDQNMSDIYGSDWLDLLNNAPYNNIRLEINNLWGEDSDYKNNTALNYVLNFNASNVIIKTLQLFGKGSNSDVSWSEYLINTIDNTPEYAKRIYLNSELTSIFNNQYDIYYIVKQNMSNINDICNKLNENLNNNKQSFTTLEAANNYVYEITHKIIDDLEKCKYTELNIKTVYTQDDPTETVVSYIKNIENLGLTSAALKIYRDYYEFISLYLFPYLNTTISDLIQKNINNLSILKSFLTQLQILNSDKENVYKSLKNKIKLPKLLYNFNEYEIPGFDYYSLITTLENKINSNTIDESFITYESLYNVNLGKFDDTYVKIYLNNHIDELNLAEKIDIILIDRTNKYYETYFGNLQIEWDKSSNINEFIKSVGVDQIQSKFIGNTSVSNINMLFDESTRKYKTYAIKYDGGEITFNESDFVDGRNLVISHRHEIIKALYEYYEVQFNKMKDNFGDKTYFDKWFNDLNWQNYKASVNIDHCYKFVELDLDSYLTDIIIDHNGDSNTLITSINGKFIDFVTDSRFNTTVIDIIKNKLNAQYIDVVGGKNKGFNKYISYTDFTISLKDADMTTCNDLEKIIENLKSNVEYISITINNDGICKNNHTFNFTDYISNYDCWVYDNSDDIKNAIKNRKDEIEAEKNQPSTVEIETETE